jgi:hypothetical protein
MNVLWNADSVAMKAVHRPEQAGWRAQHGVLSKHLSNRPFVSCDVSTAAQYHTETAMLPGAMLPSSTRSTDSETFAVGAHQTLLQLAQVMPLETIVYGSQRLAKLPLQTVASFSVSTTAA